MAAFTRGTVTSPSTAAQRSLTAAGDSASASSHVSPFLRSSLWSPSASVSVATVPASSTTAYGINTPSRQPDTETVTASRQQSPTTAGVHTPSHAILCTASRLNNTMSPSVSPFIANGSGACAINTQSNTPSATASGSNTLLVDSRPASPVSSNSQSHPLLHFAGDATSLSGKQTAWREEVRAVLKNTTVSARYRSHAQQTCQRIGDLGALDFKSPKPLSVGGLVDLGKATGKSAQTGTVILLLYWQFGHGLLHCTASQMQEVREQLPFKDGWFHERKSFAMLCEEFPAIICINKAPHWFRNNKKILRECLSEFGDKFKHPGF